VPKNKNNKKVEVELGMVAAAYNPKCLGGWDQEDDSLRPAWANSSWDPISKITRVKWTESVAQAEEHMLWKHETMSSYHNLHSQKNEVEMTTRILWGCNGIKPELNTQRNRRRYSNTRRPCNILLNDPVGHWRNKVWKKSSWDLMKMKTQHIRTYRI
jgi:hypothetical protein